MRRGRRCRQWRAAGPWGWRRPAGETSMLIICFGSRFIFFFSIFGEETAYLPDEGLPDGLVVPGKLGLHVLIAWRRDATCEECRWDECDQIQRTIIYIKKKQKKQLELCGIYFKMQKFWSNRIKINHVVAGCGFYSCKMNCEKVFMISTKIIDINRPQREREWLLTCSGLMVGGRLIVIDHLLKSNFC